MRHLKMDLLPYKKYQEIESTHWWFVGRRKIIFDFLQRRSGTQKTPLKIFDFGCNTGFLVGELQKKGYDVSGVDISETAIDYGQSQGVKNIAVYNPENFKPEKDMFPEVKFDVIFALDVIEHIENDSMALSLLKNKLNPQGCIVLMVPAFMFLWGFQDEVAHHFRRYTTKTLKEVCIQSGFTIERMTYFNVFLFFPVVVAQMWRKMIPSKKEGSDFDVHNPMINKIFTWIFCCEAFLLRYVKFPFGVSLFAVIRHHEV